MPGKVQKLDEATCAEYRFHVQPSSEGGFVVTMPDLPGGMSDGEIDREAVDKVNAAIEE